MSANTSSKETALALVHEGWNHLMSQRPQAAWGTWQRAIRLDPGSVAARQALTTLESAPDLPHAARKVYRFRHPTEESRRIRWNEGFQETDTAELAGAAQVFVRLLDDDPEDAAAWFNLGLCLAWQGRDVEAIEAFDHVVELQADEDREQAVEAWTLAEILRQGGGAERLADDLRYACTFPWKADDTPRLLELFPELRKIEKPQDPTRPGAALAEVEVLEWLDRPFPEEAGAVIDATELPRVLATVLLGPESLRLSSPRIDSLEMAEEKLRLMVGPEVVPVERVAAPLPLAFLDADVWTTRLPAGLDREAIGRLTRESVEDYYENQWIHRPRQGLDGLSPLAAAQNGRAGDPLALARLEALIQVREQLGARPSALALYQGYPFDRLRRRLGLDLADPPALDPADLSCASTVELRACNLDEINDHQLVEAFRSAAGLRDDRIAAPLAAELVRRDRLSAPGLDQASLFAPLVRMATQRGDVDQALEWLDRANKAARPTSRRVFETWRAEVLARARRPEAAVAIYQGLVDPSAQGVLLALDAAETLIDNGQEDLARPFLQQAITLGQSIGLDGIVGRARALS